jgi:hypothetical protein
MAKVLIDISTPYGGLVAAAVQKLIEANNDLQRAKAACALAVAGDGTLDAGTGQASFGGTPGQHADYNFALNAVANNLDSFMANVANAGPIAQLDQGNLT